jgi:DNA (cytosine-5)-methyltransferase 1
LESNNERFSLIKDWKLVNFCEFDKYAIKSYCAIHGVDESLNLGDITKVDETKLEDFNMICGGSPCQDFSVAGKQKGSVWTCNGCGHEYNPLTVHWSQRDKCPNCESGNIEKTRSSLLVEYLRVIRASKPNFGMYENVKNIVGKQFRDTTFKLFEDELHEYGYNTYWKVLNAKDYGIPQNRERVYLIFIKKDLDNGKFVFPEGFDNGIRLKDVLEDEVDEKYYISDDKVQRFLTNLNSNNSLLYNPCQVKREGKSREYNDYCPTLTSRDYKDPRLINENVVKQIGNISDCNGNWKNPQVGRIYDPDSCSPTLNTCSGGSHEPKIVQIGKLNSSQDGVVVSDKGIAPTHTAGHGNTPKVLETPDYSYCLDANYYKGTTIKQYVDKHRIQLVSEVKETDNKTIIQKPREFNKGGEHNICPTLSSHS